MYSYTLQHGPIGKFDLCLYIAKTPTSLSSPSSFYLNSWFVDMTIEHVFKRRQMAFVLFRLPLAIESKAANTIGAFELRRSANNIQSTKNLENEHNSRREIERESERDAQISMFIFQQIFFAWLPMLGMQLFAFWIIHSLIPSAWLQSVINSETTSKQKIFLHQIVFAEAFAREQDASHDGKK